MSTVRALPEELTIYAVAQLRSEWLGWLAEAEPAPAGDACAVPLEVAADAVAEVDAAGIQLLVSLANACRLDRRSLRLGRPSAVLVRACEGLGLAGLLPDATSRGAQP